MPEKSKKTDSKRPAEVRRLKSRINRLRARIPRLESEIDELIRKAFPRGSEIHWMRGGRHQRGYVLHYAGAERFLVKNARTGKQVAITYYEVLQADIARGEPIRLA